MSTPHPLEAEFLNAAAKMSATELSLSGALLDQNDGLITAIELLGLLTDGKAADYDAAHALVAGEVVRILRETFSRAYAAHAAVVAQINEPVVH